jgi:hypothetical protein
MLGRLFLAMTLASAMAATAAHAYSHNGTVELKAGKWFAPVVGQHPTGINSSEEIVGWTGLHGFSSKNGVLTPVNVPGAFETEPMGVNDSGVITGLYLDSGFHFHGFSLNGSTVTSFNMPGATETTPHGINNLGQIVGSYFPGSQSINGFKYDSGSFSTIDYPGADGTFITGINDSGEMVGYFGVGSVAQGFTYDGSSFTLLNIPGSNFTRPFGIDNAGDVVGDYNTPAGTRAFLYTGGVVEQLTPPFVKFCNANPHCRYTDSAVAISNTGSILVTYSVTPEPGAWLLLMSGVLMLGVALRERRRRVSGWAAGRKWRRAPA